MTVQFGIDVSNHQPDFDFAQARAEGYSFAVHKVSEGAGFADPYWPRAREELLEHFPGRCGGYVYCRTDVDPAAEADRLESVFGDKAGMRLMLDYEDDRDPGSADDLRARVEEYERRGFELLPVYLPRWYWQRIGSPDLSFLAEIGLWQSRYVDGSGYGSTLYEKTDDGHWASFGGAPVRLLQFSSSANVAGVRGVDVDAARSAEELAAIFGPSPSDGASVPSGGDGGALDPVEQRVVLDGAAQLAAPHTGGGLSLGPRPLREPERHNVAGNDPSLRQAWVRAMLMDVWNELVFDAYPVPELAARFREGAASPVEILAATHMLLKEVRDLLAETGKVEPR